MPTVYENRTLATLRDLARQRGLQVSGSKSDVIQRLRDNAIRLSPGTLSRLGYKTSDNATNRRRALKRTLRNEDPLRIFRKMNALYVLNKNNYPSRASKYLSDRNWVKREYMM